MYCQRIWAVVSDGTRARILRDLEAGAGVGAAGCGDLLLRAQAVGVRGLVTGPSSVRRRAQISARVLQSDSSAFAEDIAAMLERHRIAEDFSGLAVFAPEVLLRPLHAAMRPGLAGMVLLEVRSNYFWRPESELRGLIRDLVEARLRQLGGQ